MKDSIKHLENSLNEDEELLRSQEKELEIYREMTNLTLEPIESSDNSIEIFQCVMKNLIDQEKYLKFKLLSFNQENEMQYVPIEIKIDVGNNKVNLQKIIILFSIIIRN